MNHVQVVLLAIRKVRSHRRYAPVEALYSEERTRPLLVEILRP